MSCQGRPIVISNSRNVLHEANFRPQTHACDRRLRGCQRSAPARGKVINGQSRLTDSSCAVGVIWQVSDKLSFDVAFRHALTGGPLRQ
jgi:hypothetical protein